ncbi:MAG: hypothetical protein IMF19_06910 [Proteobacteria bacterium]|nr:hypothetical protein [Pseudomonadota bacterium]
MPIDKVEETTKTVERVELSTQKALLLLYFSCRLRFLMQNTTLGCPGIYSVGGEVEAFK